MKNVLVKKSLKDFKNQKLAKDHLQRIKGGSNDYIIISDVIIN